MVFELDIFLTGLFFIIFLIQINILGFIFLFLTNKKSLNLPILELIIFSLIIGIPLYIFYAYLIETFISFNFFTINLPILILDIFGLLNIYKKDLRIKSKLKLEHIKNYLITNKKNLLFYFLFFAVIFSCLYIQETSVMFLNTGLISKDPYYWCEMQMYLIDYGHLNYERIQAYPVGMLFLNGGSLLFYPQFNFIHSFYKFIPLFHLGLFIFIIFVFSRRFFKNKVVIFFCCFGCLLLRNFLLRFLRPTPSVLSTIFAFLIFLFFIEPKIPKKLIGFVLAGTILFHPLYGMFIIAIYFFYFLYQLILILIRDRKKQDILKPFLKSNAMLMLLFSVLLVPFMLNLTLKFKVDWIFNYFYHILPQNISTLTFINLDVFSNIIWNLFNNKIILSLFSSFNFWDSIEDFGYATFSNENIIYLFLLFFIIIPSNSKKNVLVLLKIWFILSFLFLLSYDFLAVLFPNEVDSQLFIFIRIFRLRIFEFNAGIFLLIIGFVLEQIYSYLKISKTILIEKFSIFRKLIYREFSELRKIIKNIKHSKIGNIFRFDAYITIIILILSFYRYISMPIDYIYYNEDSLVDLVLTMGENTTPYSNETILIPDFIVDSKPICRLLYRYNSIEINFSQSNHEILSLFLVNNASYLLIPLNNISLNDLEKFLLYFDIYYQNDDFLIVTYN